MDECYWFSTEEKCLPDSPEEGLSQATTQVHPKPCLSHTLSVRPQLAGQRHSLELRFVENCAACGLWLSRDATWVDFQRHPALGGSFSTAHWAVFKRESLYLLTICPGTWIGELQDKKVTSAILFVIIHLLPQNRSFDLNKLRTFAVLEGWGCESIQIELAWI